MKPSSTRGLTGSQRWLTALLFIVPLAVILGKWPGLPTSEFLDRWCSLASLPAEALHSARHILFVPLGAVLVVFCRLTLGIRVLGPFRSILLAVAFQVTGIGWGLLFLTAIMAIVVGIRPLLRFIRMPYFGRISSILSIVATVMALGMLGGVWAGLESLSLVASLPIVVLCLMGEGLAKTLAREGPRSALWRGTTTALVAVAITLVSQIPGFYELLLRFPELLVLQIGCVVIVSKLLNLRLLEWMNPKVKKRKHKAAKAKKAAAAAADGPVRIVPLSKS